MLTIDLLEQQVVAPDGEATPFDIDPFRRECLLKGLDDIGLTLRLQDKIAAYESEHHPGAHMYDRVDAVSPGTD